MRKITKERLLEQLAAAAFADFTKYVKIETGEDGQYLRVTDTKGLLKSEKSAIAGIKAGTKGIEIKLYDRLKAIEMLARFTGIFGESSDDGLRQLFEALEGGDEDIG